MSKKKFSLPFKKLTFPPLTPRTGLYGLWIFFVMIPLVLSFVPYSWGMVFEVVNNFLNLKVMGVGIVIMTLVSPILFGILFWRGRKRSDLVAFLLSALYLVLVVVNIILISRSMGDF